MANALGDLMAILVPPMALTIDQWSRAQASQGRAFLQGVQAAVPLMPAGSRIVAITYIPGSGTGGFQAYAAQGSAKAALESLVRYFAVALAKRGITVNSISPGITEDSVFNALPITAQEMVRHGAGTVGRRWAGWEPLKILAMPLPISAHLKPLGLQVKRLQWMAAHR